MIASKPSLSLALIVKNEARCLARCLLSVQGVASEIVVVDTGSTDDTVRIARECQARVVDFAWVDDFATARNFALAQATGDWILVLDADEHASPALAAEIPGFIAARPAIGRLKIVSDFRRNNQTLRSQSFVSRLFPRGAHFEGRIHEQLISPLPRLDLQGELWHDGYLEASKSARNVRLLERELERSTENVYLRYQLALEYASLNQTEKALPCLQRAYAGLRTDEPFAPNLVVAYLYALRELKHFEEGLRVIEQADRFCQQLPDFHLVCGLFYLDLVRSNPAQHLAYLPNIEQRFQRCLALGESPQHQSVVGTGTFLAYYNLGTLYHVFGEAAAARACFERAADFGYEPARQMLATLGS
jgi:glycosyltransferase involved in cell wall biosynthesis